MQSRILELQGKEGLDLFKALGSEVRLQILVLLAESPLNINALGQELGLSQPSITRHVQALEQAGLIDSEYMQGSQGTQKLCRLRYDRLIFSLEVRNESVDRFEEIEMPVGMYTTIRAVPTCGLASSTGVIGFYDDPQTFLLPERAQAQIIWIADGFVEYVFPNTLPTSVDIDRLELAMEVCSEAPDFDNDFPSDITVWVDDVEIGTWTSPGDLGGKRGRLNPPWWNDHGTQHGMLKVWSVDHGGSYVDGSQVSDVTLRDVGVGPKAPVSVRIGVKPDAEHPGGFNLFGRGFGNYEQDIVLRLHYTNQSRPHRAESAGKAMMLTGVVL